MLPRAYTLLAHRCRARTVARFAPTRLERPRSATATAVTAVVALSVQLRALMALVPMQSAPTVLFLRTSRVVRVVLVTAAVVRGYPLTLLLVDTIRRALATMRCVETALCVS